MRYIPPTNNRGDAPRRVANTVNSMVNSTKTLQDTTESLQTDLTAAESDITDIQSDITDIDADIAAIEAAQAAVTRTLEQVKFTPIAEPGTPSEGDTYMDSTSHKLRTYDGTTWQDHW